MPELPEVEVTKMGIAPYLQGKSIREIKVRQPKLRWPVPDLIHQAEHTIILSIKRRGKYLLLETELGCIVIHLGMSGSLRILAPEINGQKPPEKHEHIDLICSDNTILRYKDPRRFGAWLWQEKGTYLSVLQKLGVEPLSDDFTSRYLRHKLQHKKIAIKQALMDSHIVVGIGNIYATESLFLARIDPRRPASKIKLKELTLLVDKIKQVLTNSIKQGGTTLKDFTHADGHPGYFAQKLEIYGKAGEECPLCHEILQTIKLGQRSSVFCPHCQK